jgi:steroid delta-isomerase-like uncharacterized protein
MNTSAEAAVGRYYDAFNAGDRAGMIACLSDDFYHDVNEGTRRDGKQRFAEFMAHMDTCYREQLKDIVVMASANGTRAAAEFIVHGEYLSTDEGLPPARGQRYMLPAGAFFSLREGKITRVTTYYNLKDWIRQVSG